MPAPILLIYAHPASHQSRVNRRLLEAARAIDGVTVRDLYETYPDFYIDVAREQASLRGASSVVFVHPIQWYSMPSLLKEWMDSVLLAGWAYGPGGDALHGKGYWLALTTGSPEDAYRAGGLHGRAFADYLPQYQQTAALCGMHWLEPLILHGAHRVDEAQVDAHVAAFAARLRALTHPSSGT